MPGKLTLTCESGDQRRWPLERIEVTKVCTFTLLVHYQEVPIWDGECEAVDGGRWMSGSSVRVPALYLKWGFSAALLAAIVGIYLLPSPIDPEPFMFDKPPHLVGPLAVNRRIHEGTRLFYGQLKGPESFTSDHEGNLYTGTVDGKLWRIHGEHLQLVTQMGKNVSGCGESPNQLLCLKHTLLHNKQ
ncbi:PREDICTED: adipocyte plasma membrane-associated protein-like, partial [Nanorana parkeri]|uniref:adipocyte plasma membrane-associated protein-like n=1 Tax=Nanorana parkeri TaxID=125878 RepID=UPI000853F92E